MFSRFGIYIHFGYCISKCGYCDFASQPASKIPHRIPHRRYARSVARELELRSNTLGKRSASSLYIGGGTPSLWEPAALSEALVSVREKIEFTKPHESTIEVNPGAASFERFRELRTLGFDRISLGVQSFHDEILKQLGRVHSAADAVLAIRSARETGFTNLSLDLIYGAPGQNVELAYRDARRAVEECPEHLSCYALTLDNLAIEVPMARAVRLGQIDVPDDDAQWEMGVAIGRVLRESGFQRYEISSWAKPGFPSLHNKLYWTGGEYLGLGCGAAGFMLHEPSDPSLGGRRWSNLRSPDEYMDAVEAGRLPESWSEEIDANTLLREVLTIGLRQTEGVRFLDACRLLRQDPEPIFANARLLEEKGLATLGEGVIALTPKGLDFHSEAVLVFV